jgi:predicted acylesterase/phospholipase RssA
MIKTLFPMPTSSAPATNPYHILSLDGGGSWALIQIRALQKIFRNDHIPGREVLKHFDLVVANSGGSISAMAMAENCPLSRIIDFYLDEEKRRQVFVELSFWEKGPGRRVIKGLTGVGPKYKTSEKLKGLRQVLEDIGDNYLSQLPQIIGEGSPHFLICTFDYDRERAAFFRSDRRSKAQTHVIAQDRGQQTSSSFEEVTVAQALHASSNAPLNFFDEPAKFDPSSNKPQRRFWDGAVGGYNNPVMAGLTEALCNGIRLEDIRILSIGTGTDFRPLKSAGPAGTGSAHPILCQEPEKQTLGNDIEKMATSILSDPPDAATFTTYTLLSAQRPAGPLRLVRMNPLIQPVKRNHRWELPEGLRPAEFAALVKLDMDAVEQWEVKLVDKFCGLWLEDKVPNQPVRMDSNLVPVLGHGWFSEAREAAAAFVLKAKNEAADPLPV